MKKATRRKFTPKFKTNARATQKEKSAMAALAEKSVAIQNLLFFY